MVSFVTWNLYAGADLTPLFHAAPPQIPQGVTEVFRQFLATHFSVRAKAIASAIAEKRPDVIGLQEVSLVQFTIPNVDVVIYDFLQMVISHLKNRGLHFEVAVINDNVLLQLPTSHGNVVRMLDRDVILLRKDSGFKVVHRQNGNFITNFTVKIGRDSCTILRGWSSVDIEGKRVAFRVINTHLESYSPGVQVAQGMELLSESAHTTLPLILLGDLNSNDTGSGTPTYGNFIASGFHDLWLEVGKGQGFTCCQDFDLLNGLSGLNQRIDYILFKNGWTPGEALLLGGNQRSGRERGLWPSDHAGVYGSLHM